MDDLRVTARFIVPGASRAESAIGANPRPLRLGSLVLAAMADVASPWSPVGRS